MSAKLFSILSYLAGAFFVSSLEISLARWFDPSFFPISALLISVCATFILVAILVSRLKDGS